MPRIKIELASGRAIETLVKMKDLVMDAVVETLQLPQNDRNIMVNEYAPGLFGMKAPYEILIEIMMFPGRTKETKKKLYQTIVQKLEQGGIVEKEKVFIIVVDIPKENWGVRGGIPADEINLEFKVEI